MRILVLDDEPARHNLFAAAWGKRHDIVQAWTADEAEKALDGERFDLVTLDHDLGPASRGNGVRVARFIARMSEDRQPPQVFVHSANPVGAQAMISTLLRTGIDVRRVDPLRL